MSLASRTRIGPYEVVGPLGDGGMGEVYRATDTKLKRQVANELLPPSLAEDAARLARFQREAEVLASLNHRHIAAIYRLPRATRTLAALNHPGGRRLMARVIALTPGAHSRHSSRRVWPVAEAAAPITLLLNWRPPSEK